MTLLQKVPKALRKDTYMYEKRPTYMKRDLHIWKETCICEKFLKLWERTPPCNLWERTPTCMKRDIHLSEKGDLHIWKETYLYEKRPTYNLWERTPTCMKRDLYISVWKETYIYVRKETNIYLHQKSPRIPPIEPSTIKRALWERKPTYNLWERTLDYFLQ